MAEDCSLDEAAPCTAIGKWVRKRRKSRYEGRVRSVEFGLSADFPTGAGPLLEDTARKPVKQKGFLHQIEPPLDRGPLPAENRREFVQVQGCARLLHEYTEQ